MLLAYLIGIKNIKGTTELGFVHQQIFYTIEIFLHHSLLILLLFHFRGTLQVQQLFTRLKAKIATI